jgi:hypothetical protein
MQTRPRLETVARLIAIGYPPPLAARSAGYSALPSRRWAMTTPPQKAPPRGAAPETTPTPKLSFEPPMTKEAWVAKYGAMLRARAGTGA